MISNFKTNDKNLEEALEKALKDFNDDYFKSENSWNKVVEIIHVLSDIDDLEIYFRFLEKEAVAFGDSWFYYASRVLDFSYDGEHFPSRRDIRNIIAEHCIYKTSWSKFLDENFDTRDVKIKLCCGGFIL